MKYPRFKARVYNKLGKMVSHYHSHHLLRFYTRCLPELLRGFTIYIKVTYGKGMHNEGEYSNKKDAKQAFKAFTEKDLIDDLTKS